MAKSRVAGNAKILLTLDDRVQAGLRKLQSRFSAMSKPLLALGASSIGIGTAIAGSLFAASLAFAKSGDELDKMSKRTGISVESLSELSHATKLSGTSMEVLERAAREMQKKGLDPNTFDQMADRIAAIEDPVRRAREAMELWGTRYGTMLLPMLKDLPELRKQARALALTMSTEDATAAAEWNDALDTTRAQFGKLIEKIGTAVAGPLTDFLTWSQNIIAAGIRWAEANRETVKMAAMLAGGFIFAGVGLTILGAMFAAASVVAGGLATAFAAVTSAIAAAASPVSFAVRGIAALAGFMANATEAGRAMVTNLSNWFGHLFTIAQQTFGGMAKALAGGDITAAGEILWLGLKLLWQQGTHELEKIWSGWKFLAVGTMMEVRFTVEETWAKMIAALKKGWNEFSRWFADAMATIHIFLGVSESKKNELLQGISDREREARANAGDISAERDKALAEIDARRKDSERTRDATLTENLADAEAELKDARSRFEQKSAEIAAAEPPEKIKAELEDAQASLEGFGLGTSSKPQAILDASLAAQQFGGRDDEMITELRGIRENTKPKKFVFNGLPVS